jgi:hypothetical protein
VSQAGFQRITWKRIRGGLLFATGWLLSPLCWWNDLIFNLPVAYGFGYLLSKLSPDWLLGGTIAGYWLSNLVGILLMQVGAIEVFQNQDRNLKKDLLWGVVSSSVFTVIAIALIQFQILEIPTSLLEGSFDLASLLPRVKGE